MLPRMQAVQPTVVPPTTGGTYPDWYNNLMLVRSLAGDEGTATLKYLPYNFETKEVLDDEKKGMTVTVNNFWTFVLTRPTLAQALGVLTTELAKVAQEKELTRLIQAEQAKETPDQAVIDAWQAQMDAVLASYAI